MTERDKTCQSALGSLNQVGNVSMSERPCNSTLLGILARAHHWQFGTFDYARGKDRIGPGIWASLDRIGMGATWIDCTIKHCFIYCLSFEVVQIKENVRLEIHVWGMQGPTGDKASELKLVATYGEDLFDRYMEILDEPDTFLQVAHCVKCKKEFSPFYAVTGWKEMMQSSILDLFDFSNDRIVLLHAAMLNQWGLPMFMNPIHCGFTQGAPLALMWAWWEPWPTLPRSLFRVRVVVCVHWLSGNRAHLMGESSRYLAIWVSKLKHCRPDCRLVIWLFW